jgi:hypothetical protein
MHEICQQLHDPTPNRGPLFGLNDATILEMLTTEKNIPQTSNQPILKLDPILYDIQCSYCFGKKVILNCNAVSVHLQKHIIYQMIDP